GAELGSAALYRIGELGEVLRLSRIGMVVREAAVDLAVELGDLAAEAPVEARRQHPGDAVAAVDRDLHRACELHVADDALDVGIEHIGLATLAAAGLEIPALGAVLQLLD